MTTTSVRYHHKAESLQTAAVIPSRLSPGLCTGDTSNNWRTFSRGALRTVLSHLLARVRLRPGGLGLCGTAFPDLFSFADQQGREMGGGFLPCERRASMHTELNPCKGRARAPAVPKNGTACMPACRFCKWSFLHAHPSASTARFRMAPRPRPGFGDPWYGTHQH